MSRTPQKCKLLKLPPLKIRISSEHSKLTSLDTLKTNYLSTEMTNSFENNHYKIVSMKKKSCICSVPITHFNKNRRDEIRKRAQSIIDTLLEREEGKDFSFLITGMKEDYTNLIDPIKVISQQKLLKEFNKEEDKLDKENLRRIGITSRMSKIQMMNEKYQSVEVFDERTAKNGYKKIIEELHLNERKPKRFVFSNSIYKPIVKRKKQPMLINLQNKESYYNFDQRLNHSVKSANDCLYYINQNQEDFNNKKIMLNQL